MDIRLRDASLVAMFAGEDDGNRFLSEGADALGEIVVRGMIEDWPVKVDPQAFVLSHDGVDDSPEYKDLKSIHNLMTGTDLIKLEALEALVESPTNLSSLIMDAVSRGWVKVPVLH